MKIRSDFVTNSSSSSFIIGKNGDEITKEDVYQMIRQYFIEYHKIKDQIKEYLDKHAELNAELSPAEGNDWQHIVVKGTKDVSVRYDAPAADAIKSKFGFSVWDYFSTDTEWISSCETYADFEAYWIRVIKEKARNIKGSLRCAPFTLADYSCDTDVKWLHYGSVGLNFDGKLEKGTKSEILEWYYPYAEEARKDISCEECDASWCDKESCMDTRKRIKNIEFTEDNACLMLLGKICIFSECGYIPDYVVEKIADKSQYYCNHMG